MTQRLFGLLIVGLLTLSGCNQFRPQQQAAAPTEGLDVVRQFLSTDAPLAPYQPGNSYTVQGVSYSPAENFSYSETGTASYYSSTLNGALTASGETYSSGLMTAAHKTLPFQTIVRVTNVQTGRAVVVRINDRGPFVDGRIIDLSERAARDLSMIGSGTARVNVEVLADETRAFAAALSNGRQIQVAETSATSTDTATDTSTPTTSSSTPVSTSAGGFYVQVGTYTSVSDAAAIRDRMSALGNATVEASSGVYKVFIGPLASRLDAQAMLGRVFAQGATNASVVQR